MSLSLVVDDPKKEDTKGVGYVSEHLLFVCLFFLELTYIWRQNVFVFKQPSFKGL